MLKVEGLVKSYGAVQVVKDVSFEIANGECYALLGPSGCGKTTTLRCVAGLEVGSGGRIEIAGKVVFDAAAGINVPVHERPIGMVFQSYAIWPHLNVFENVAFPLRVARERISEADIRQRTMDALRLVDMDAYAERPATALSGGQQQRVALARAFVRNPTLLLLDEPLSNLDARLRDTMRKELSDLIARVGVTALFVTHDQAEAFAIAQCMAVMHGGHILQSGTPKEIYRRPTHPFVATFLGAANVLRGKTAADGIVLEGGQHLAIGHAFAADMPVVSVVRPERIGICDPQAKGTEAAMLQGKLVHSSYLGSVTESTVEIAPGTTVRVTETALDDRPAGEPVGLRFDPADVLVFPLDGNTVL